MAIDNVARIKFKLAAVIRKKKCSLNVANNVTKVIMNVAKYEPSKIIIKSSIMDI